MDLGGGKFQCAEISAVEVNGKVRGEVTVSLRGCLTSVQELTTHTRQDCYVDSMINGLLQIAHKYKERLGSQQSKLLVFLTSSVTNSNGLGLELTI